MELIKVQDLSFSYPNEKNTALKDINLSIEKGDFFVLCGHSGCGKSTLLRQLKPTIAPHGTLSGTIYYKGIDIKQIDEKISCQQIGFVMQSPESQVVTDKVWHELCFGMESLGFDSETIQRRSGEMASFFGIENWYYKNVSDLSGGQKQLLCLASVMTLQPEILILDEPTSQLDPIAASEFISTLGKINRELGITILLSEHRLEDAFALANKAAVMEKGEIRTVGTVAEIGNYLKKNKNTMFSAMPAAMRIWGSCDTDITCPITVNDGRNFLNEYIKERETIKLEEPAPYIPNGKEKVIADEVWFRYEKNLPDVVRGLSFKAYEGEFFCILGGNGSGKTTSLKLLGGLKTPYRGDIKINGTIGMLPQDPKTVFLKKTVYEDLEDTLKCLGYKGDSIQKEIENISSLCLITKLLTHHPYDLSGGEQQRAALAKILLMNPDVLLLDEPTKGLDAPFKKEFAGILKKLTNSGVTIIMVSHDIEFCANYADQCGLFFDGHIIACDSPKKFFAGNSFYTTAANRMARDIDSGAITAEDVIELIGGKANKEEITKEKAVMPKPPKEEEREKKSLPLWRKIGALISFGAALFFLLYSSANENLSEFINKGGMSDSGWNQLVLYGVFIVLLILSALFLGKRDENKPVVQIPKEKRKLSKRTIIASVMILLLIPITLFIGVFYLEKKQYYVTALAVLIECMLPFFLIFEGRKPKARELVTIASLCAMGIAGRAAFFMLPQFKPVMAMTIISGVAFGGESGFLVGAVTMLVSNILFSQGPWTPWQMFAMGIIGFLAGILFRKGILVRSKEALCTFGVIVTFLIYGGIMNPASAFIWGSESLNLKMILSYYLTGFPMDAVHAAATALFLWFGAKPMLEKLDRIKEKYGLVE